MIDLEVRLSAHDLDMILDEAEVSGRKERAALLERGYMIAMRGLVALAEEPFIEDPDGYLADLAARCPGNIAEMKEELRHDSIAFRAFLGAECRLLTDLGVRQETIARIRTLIAEVIRDPEAHHKDLQARMRELIVILGNELSHINDDARHESMWRRLTGVLEILCGALLVAGNALAGTATAGAAIVGAALSGAAGTEVISRGLDAARDA